MLFVLALARSSQAAPAGSEFCDNINNCRRLFDIVWGCLVTIFACVWVSVHPNVPPRRPAPPANHAPLWRRLKWKLIDSSGALKHRLKLMFIGILAPELIAGWAGRQLAVAWYFSKKYDVSLTHGFFIGMGGFVDREGHPIVTCAQIEQPGCLEAVKDVSESAIDDKSKGDTFSKGIAFFQGVWFVVQCIARAAQHLPITELEVATLAFAFINIFTWLLWWHKPLDVQDPIAVGPALVQGHSKTLHKSARSWSIALDSFLEAHTSERYNPLAEDTVPTFWYVSSEDDESADLTNTMMFPIIGTFFVAAGFGAIHCAGWNTSFASTEEMWMWRVSSVLLAGLPIVGPVLMLSLDKWQFVVVFIICLLYALARLVMIVLPLIALRTLPPAIFMDVDWSVYIPHL
ncbi:hypothetical protein C8F01DRAFT_1256456 [Mycena amicta]|nr:hypothetical protein C8F01DRAFT_1256456 [Mycena amicta]